MFWLHRDGLEQFECPRLWGVRRGDDLEARRIVATASGAAGVTHDGAEFVLQGANAGCRRAVFEAARRGVARGLRALRRRHLAATPVGKQAVVDLSLARLPSRL